MNSLTNYLLFPAGSDLLSRWQAGDDSARVKLRSLFDAAMEGEFDAIFREQAPSNSVSVTTSLHLLTLTILNQLYGLVSADFYKGDPQRYVLTTLITQRLLGIRKLTLHWPVYAFGAEALGQAMLYPKKHAPGVNAGEPLIDRKNWHELGKPDFEGIVPQIIEEMLVCFSELTGREPVAHLPAPYSLAADILGQEALLFALMDEPIFVDDLLAHLTEQVFVPWCARLSQRIPNVWIELSDASGSPVFIGPRLFRRFAAPPVHRLIRNFPWGERVFVANYRGDMPMRQTVENEQRKVESKTATDALIELIDF
ncbi:MAG: uroporphyrinogen decarboxylase family protein, partial [Chloroflexota bacterium]|nr:uroporphyrinogen decarboxylase family protein [Chloroflexota bacterium]